MWACMCITLHGGSMHGGYNYHCHIIYSWTAQPLARLLITSYIYIYIVGAILFNVAIHVLPHIATMRTTIECHQAAGSQWLLCGSTTWCACGYVCSTVSTKHYTLCVLVTLCVTYTLYRFRDSVLMPSSQPESQSPSCDKQCHSQALVLWEWDTCVLRVWTTTHTGARGTAKSVAIQLYAY